MRHQRCEQADPIRSARAGSSRDPGTGADPGTGLGPGAGGRLRHWWALLAAVVAVALLAPVLVAPSPAAADAPAGDAPAAAGTAEQPALPEITESVSPEGFLHPGGALTADQLQTAQQQVSAGVEPWTSYYQAMSQTEYAATDYVADNQGPTDDEPVSDAYDQVAMRSRAHADSLGALTQALMYLMTGEETYRANALHALRTWSSLDPEKYEYFSDAHIHTGVPLYQFVTAAEILRATTPVHEDLDGYDLRWTDRDQQRAEENLVRPTIETFLFSQNRLWNQHTYGVIGMVAGAIFLDDADLYAERVEWFTVNSTFEPTGTINGGDINGGLTSLMRQIEADDELNPYGHDFVELVEMGRDQAHAEGDVTTVTAIARMINNQGTLLDPQEGTVSTQPDAVTPYEFGDYRILEGADKFVQFMMGEEVPFIDTSGGASTLSQAYRGRLRELMNELYYQYTYVVGVDVAEKAPFLAELYEHRDGPLYYYGGEIENFWNTRGSDFTGSEYWPAFPAELAEQDVQVPGPADSAQVPLSRYGHVIGDGAAHRGQGGESFVRLDPARGDATVAVRRMVWADRSETALVGIQVRARGPVTLQALRTADDEPFAEIQVPNTHGEWTQVWLDLDSATIPPATVGDHILYLRATDGARVDVAGVLSDATDALTPPVFDDAPGLDLVAVAGERLSFPVPVTDEDSGVDLELQLVSADEQPTSIADALRWLLEQLLPWLANTPELAGDGVLTWTPSRPGTHEVLVVATDGQATTTLPMTITVLADRDAAIDALVADLEPEDSYTTASYAPVADALSSARDAVENTDEQTFATLLEELRTAVEGLELLNPRLADGSLDFTQVVTSPDLESATLAALVDGDNQSTWGDQRVPSILLDLGPGYRVQADQFGFLARDTFSNRAEGTNVYGSDDAVSWTLLTEHPNEGRDDAIEYVDVRDEVADQQFRFLKLQVDEPGVPSDPAYPGIWTLADFRIVGERSEAVGSMDTVTLSAPDAVAGRVVAGDRVQLQLSGDPDTTDVTASILGTPVEVTSTGAGQWTAEHVLSEGEAVGEQVTFSIGFTTPDGRTADPVAATTDGSGLYVSTDSGLVDGAFGEARVTSPDLTASPDHEVDAARLFDADASTHTDTRSFDGTIAITWDFGAGASVSLDAAEILVRQDGYGISRIQDLRLEGSDDGQTWSRLTPAEPAGTLEWQQWAVEDHGEYRYVRLVNGEIMGVAELRLYGSQHVSELAVDQVSLTSSGPAGNYAVAGDDLTLDVTLRSEITDPTATFTGVATDPVTVSLAPVDGDGLHLQATVPVTDPDVGEQVDFELSYTGVDGAAGPTVAQTTDDTSVRLGTDTGYLADITDSATMITPTGEPDTSTLAQPHHLFDMDLSTATDARVVEGSADIVWDFGDQPISVDRAELAVRQDSYGLSRIDGMELQGSADLETWTPVAGTPTSTLRWQDLPAEEGAGNEFRYLRLTNQDILNVAELRLYGSLG